MAYTSNDCPPPSVIGYPVSLRGIKRFACISNYLRVPHSSPPVTTQLRLHSSVHQSRVWRGHQYRLR